MATKPIPSPDRSVDAGTRLHGRWLILARVVWVMLAALTLGLLIASIPSTFAFLHIVCTGAIATCRNNGQLIPVDLHTIQALGFSIDFYATYWVALYIGFIVGFATIGALIFWRKSDDRMALFASLALIMFPAGFNSSELATLPSAWALPGQFVAFLGNSFLFLFFYLFPTGRFVPRWTRWLWIGVVVFWAVDSFFPTLSFNSSILFSVLLLGFVGSALGSQIYRYRRVSNRAQQQQTKWVVYGISTGLGSFLVLELFSTFFPSIVQSLFVNVILGTAFYLALFIIPLSIGVAILRSRLFDIDILINRTLVYGSLTVILALFYFVSIFVLQSLVSIFTGHISTSAQSPFVLVISTLGLYALFQPLRFRIQTLIDRRFYRFKYDAARTLAEFSKTLSNEVDLNKLREDLLAVVQETMQPSHVSLWLRDPDASKERNTRLLPDINNES
ncbi:MAG TPA: hypothetical protein VN954_11165 [Ktedonobacteraceae bacterium]|nr:hypothetical protein [Ktedonobacteraceae bacterium]